MGPHPPGLRAVGGRRVDGRHRRPRPLLSLVHGRCRARAAARPRPLDRRMDGGRDGEWMDGIDDLARFYLWFMDVAGLVRPHVLGHSIGGWTAAEMATMSPGSIDRLILVAPAGLKPETGEILDVFYYPPPQLLPMTVHGPKTGPE